MTQYAFAVIGWLFVAAVLLTVALIACAIVVGHLEDRRNEKVAPVPAVAPCHPECADAAARSAARSALHRHVAALVDVQQLERMWDAS